MAKPIFAALLPALFLAAALPAPAAPETLLYDGKAAASAGLTVAPWGAGSGQDSTEVYLFGGHSLKITTLDLYQGAQIAFAAPVPLNATEAGRAFQITIRRGAPTLHYDPRTLPGADTATPADPNAPNPNPTDPNAPNANVPTAPGDVPTPPGNFPVGNFPQGNFPPGLAVPGSPLPAGTGRHHHHRQPDGAAPPDSTAAPVDTGPKPTIPPVTKLHLVFTFADGSQADVLRPIPDVSDSTVGQNWYSVTVPFSLVKLPASGSALKSMTIGGDQFGVFYVGRIRLATDTASITASIDAPALVGADVPFTLRAKAEGGLSALKYSWDFGSAGDPSEIVTGSETTTAFSDAGQDYTVTLTVSDPDGIKPSVTVTKKIHVADSAPQGQGPFPNGAPGN